mmetsp:Transcript_30743/g.72609  ORF Transcript_30743/g.72609 Transcript_30743/m.72609 type:complete len:423 (+) Transcript_30743:136-1404(+)
MRDHVRACLIVVGLRATRACRGGAWRVARYRALALDPARSGSGAPGLDAGVRAGGGDGAVVDPAHLVDAALGVAERRLGLGLLGLEVPHEQGRVDAGRGEYPRTAVGQRGDARRVEALQPRDERRARRHVPDNDLLVGAAAGEGGAVGREGDGGDRHLMPLQLGHHPARGVEEVDGGGLALGSDGHEGLVGGDGDAGGLEVELDLGLELCGLDEQQRVPGALRGDGDRAARSAHLLGRVLEAHLGTVLQGRGGGVDEGDRVVLCADHQPVGALRDIGDAIARWRAADGRGLTAAEVPRPCDAPELVGAVLEAAREEPARRGAQAVDRCGVSPLDARRRGRRGRVEEAHGAVERVGEDRVGEECAADLHVLHRAAQGEGGHLLERGCVDDLDALVGGAGDDLRAVELPARAVDAARVHLALDD